MESLFAFAPLLACPLMLLFMGGGVARALKRRGQRTANDHQA